MARCAQPILHAARDIRLDDVSDPELHEDGDAIVRVVASCVCGSDLWPYRGINEVNGPTRIGHEFVGIVEQVGVERLDRQGWRLRHRAVHVLRQHVCALRTRGAHVMRPTAASGAAMTSKGHSVDGGQGEIVRVPVADGTLVATPSQPSQELIAHLLTLSDVFPTGHHAAVSAGVTAGSTVAVVGDGAVGLSAILAAKRLGAAKIVAMSRHEDRQRLAREFGADEVVAERGKEGAAAVREMLDGIGADHVLECVGTNESMKQAMLSVRPGGRVGYVGVPHDVELNVPAMFSRNVGIAGGVAPVRDYIEEHLAGGARRARSSPARSST